MYKRKFFDCNYSKLPKLSDFKSELNKLKNNPQRIELLVRKICSDLCYKRAKIEGYTCIDYCNEAEIKLKDMNIDVRKTFSSIPIAGSEHHAFCQVKIDEEWYDFEPQSGDACLNYSFYIGKNKIDNYYQKNSQDNKNNIIRLRSFEDIKNIENLDMKEYSDIEIENIMNEHNNKIENLLKKYSNNDITLERLMNLLEKEQYFYSEALFIVRNYIKKLDKDEINYKNKLNEINEKIREYYTKENSVSVKILKSYKKCKGVLPLDIAKKMNIDQNKIFDIMLIYFDIGIVNIITNDEGIKYIDFI